MKCPECGGKLIIAHSKFVSEVGSTDVYNELTLVCINPKCDSYAGKDLNNPLKIVKIERRKVN